MRYFFNIERTLQKIRLQDVELSSKLLDVYHEHLNEKVKSQRNSLFPFSQLDTKVYSLIKLNYSLYIEMDEKKIEDAQKLFDSPHPFTLYTIQYSLKEEREKIKESMIELYNENYDNDLNDYLDHISSLVSTTDAIDKFIPCTFLITKKENSHYFIEFSKKHDFDFYVVPEKQISTIKDYRYDT